MVKRTPIHTRSIEMNAYLRDDGLWDFDARLIDTKGYNFTKRSGQLLRAGEPVHNIHLVITTDASGLITEVNAYYDAAPYNEVCSAIAIAYQDLIGMHLLRGFAKRVRERFAKTSGCTHLSELVVLLPTVFVQSVAKTRNTVERDSGKRPFQLGGCHAYALNSLVTKEFYPKWYISDVPERV